MGIGVAAASGAVGLLAGVPAAGVAFAVPAEGPVCLPRKWWLGGGVPPRQVAVVVAAAGATAAAVGVLVGWSLTLPAFVWSAVLGVVLTVVDVRRRRLPFMLCVPMYAGCLLCFGVASLVTDTYAGLVRAVLAGVLTLMAFLALALVFAGQFGLGDVVLAGGLAMSLGWLTWTGVGVGLLAGFVLQATTGAVLVAWRRVRLRDPLPMAPALLIGWFVGVMMSVG